MKAEETNFLKFLSSPKQLVIPIYQRTYSWKDTECLQLWKDILKAGGNPKISGHFVGSIVYIEKGLYQASALPKLLVIDGQQRLTTLSLLVAALRDFIKANGISTQINPDKLNSYYLLNEKEEGEDKYKLILTQSDKNSLFKVLDERKLDDEDSKNIKINYETFLKDLTKDNFYAVYQGLSKLIIIDVSLDRERDNPQLIFESLNSTGLELTQADLVRNYILMGLEKQKQEEIYNKYWYPMERSFGHSENSELFDRFMKDYLTIKIGRIPTIREIYSEFKQYSAKHADVKELVQEIEEYSKYYVNIALEKEPDDELRGTFADINELKVDVAYPFILNVYPDYVKNIITKEEFVEILRTVESYVFRRAICGVPTNSLNKTFANLYKKISKTDFMLSLKAKMVLQDSYRRFPDDDEFTKEFLIKDLYNFRNRNYLLRKLENHKRKETVDVESYTIEHVMPQNENPPETWKLELGKNWKEIQKKYLHTIGNLTLTGYNSEYQDLPFLEKRDKKNEKGEPIGFKDSPIRLNRYLATLDRWNEQEIQIRAKQIAELALTIWSFPKVDPETLSKYKDEEAEPAKQTYTIEDHDHLKQGEPMRSIFDELRKKILNIDSSVREEPTKLYVAYKSVTNFVDIVPQKRALSLRLNIPFEKIKDPQGKAKDISGKGKWGNGDTEVKVESRENIDYAIGLIKQAFYNVIESENGA